MAFSGALTLTDLNDFITPSQACIKPVEQLNLKPLEEKEPGAASTEIHIDSGGSYYEVSANALSPPGQGSGPGKKLEQAQISLNDCLACSGCITSAESVLITLQSHTEVLTFLESNSSGDHSSLPHKLPVISIAPQTLASLASSLSSSSPTYAPTTPRQVLRRIRVFCKDVLGFAHVFDTTFARHLALMEHAREFEERREKDRAGGVEGEGQLPMLASACPGWICYAEKAHAEMLPFIARTKSPQQVMGTLVKTWMGEKWGKLPHEIYHVSVMPCYDKKLEASRQDFYNDVYSTRDVDCVITTGELELLMHEKGWDLSTPVPGELDAPPPSKLDPNSISISDYSLPELQNHPGTSSGSYLHSILNHITATTPTPLALSIKMIRNSDYEEYTLKKVKEGGDGEVVFKGVKCYGFRNLQNVVRKVGKERGVRVGGGAAGKLGGRVGGWRGGVVRRGRKAGAGGEGGEIAKDRVYDYVEVMACPGGCVNGGGQLKPPTLMSRAVANDKDEEGYKRDWEESGAVGVALQNAKWGDKEWMKKVEEAYWHDLPTRPASLSSAFLHGNSGVPPSWENVGGENGDLSEERRDVGSALGRHRGIVNNLKVECADWFVEHVLADICLTDERLGDVEMGEENKACRGRLLRTQYRAVESEVVGLAVKW